MGLLCLRDDDGVGACQIQDECAGDDDCPGSLVCAGESCTNACTRDDDCPSGATCEVLERGARGCVDRAETDCELSSSCGSGLVCAPDRRCREPCRRDRDCRDGRQCLAMDATGASMTVCGLPAVDGGVDAGSDGGVDAGSDGGVVLPEPPSLGLVSGGTGHTCVGGSTVRCWGSWSDALAGTTAYSYPSPTEVAVGGVADALMAGGNHDCVLVAGEVRCWGDNSAGQLARDPATVPFSETAVAVALPSPARALAPALTHTCVALEDGSVWCWGANGDGQLGHAGSGPTPAPVTGLPSAAVDVAARSQTSCAVLLDGSVWCWGSNDGGQLGRAGAGGPTPGPVALASAVEVDVGTTFACARGTDGRVRCWGSNDTSQLAMAAGGSSLTPVAIPLPARAVEIEAGIAHACARLDDDSVHCWGFNASRQVGSPTGTFIATPFEVTDGLEMTTGEIHSCVRTAATVLCWGGNQGGQLGTGSGSTPAPTAVPGL